MNDNDGIDENDGTAAPTVATGGDADLLPFATINCWNTFLESIALTLEIIPTMPCCCCRRRPTNQPFADG